VLSRRFESAEAAAACVPVGPAGRTRMSDQDPGIKLFGRVIPLAPEPALGTTDHDQPPEELLPRALEEEEEAAAADEVSMILHVVATQLFVRLFFSFQISLFSCQLSLFFQS